MPLGNCSQVLLYPLGSRLRDFCIKYITHKSTHHLLVFFATFSGDFYWFIIDLAIVVGIVDPSISG